MSEGPSIRKWCFGRSLHVRRHAHLGMTKKERTKKRIEYRTQDTARDLRRGALRRSGIEKKVRCVPPKRSPGPQKSPALLRLLGSPFQLIFPWLLSGSPRSPTPSFSLLYVKLIQLTNWTRMTRNNINHLHSTEHSGVKFRLQS